MAYRTILPTLLAAVLAAAGCRPRVVPVDAEFRRLTLEEMTEGVIELGLSNPNRFALDIDSLRYVLLLGVDTVALGSRPLPVHIGAQDSTLAEFPFELRLDIGDVLGRLPELLSDTAWLRLEGRYRLPGLGARYRLPFTYARAVPLADEVQKFVERLKGLWGGGD